MSQGPSAETTSLGLILPLFTANTLPAPKQVIRIVPRLDSSETSVVGPVHGALPVGLVQVTLRGLSNDNNKCAETRSGLLR